jgi:Holliday junction resolvasome RuvABC endonuclease subunit
MTYFGIDYSMTSPAVCIFDDSAGEFKFENCSVHYLTQSKKYDVSFKNVYGHYFEFDNDMHRYEIISSFFLDRVLENEPGVVVYIEDYSLGSRGRVFNIAENTGVLKYRFYQFQVSYDAVPPTVIKKFATGKGNADKEKMQQTFESETPIRLKHELNMTAKQWNPSSDIIDAYYICKYGYVKHNNLEN